MIAKTNSASVLGIDAHPVDVEVDVSIGLSTFNIVGLPDGTIKESRDRVTAAVTNSGFNFPVRRIVVNLAPAALRKIGSGFDLPIALALLGALRYFPEQVLEKVMVVGELSLDGAIRPIRGILPVAVAARDHGFEQLILPKANEAEAAVVEEVRRVPWSGSPPPSEARSALPSPSTHRFLRDSADPTRSIISVLSCAPLVIRH